MEGSSLARLVERGGVYPGIEGSDAEELFADLAKKIVLPDDFAKTSANIVLIKALQNVIETAFKIMGITPIKELR